MINRRLRPLVPVFLPLLLLLPSVALGGGNRMQDCLAELSIRGGISAPDVVSEGDPFFHHVGFYGRDEKENVYYGEPLFFLFRPAHGGGTLRFDLHVGRRVDRSFYGGRFRVRFGSFETETVNVSIERDPERLSLLDADSKVLWRTYKASVHVTMTIPPGEEAVPIQAEMPNGGTFFLTGLRFEPTPVGAQVAVRPQAGSGDFGGGVTAAPGTATRTPRPGPSTPKTPPRPTAPANPTPAPLDASTLKRLEKIVAEQDRSLAALSSLLDRARTKRSGHPAFLHALDEQLKVQKALQKRLEGIARNPGGYGW